MSSGTKICKICGIEYPYCKTVVKEGVFRYQDVACCPEHGSEYLRQIIESRMTPEEKAAKAQAEEQTPEPVNSEEDTPKATTIKKANKKKASKSK